MAIHLERRQLNCVVVQPTCRTESHGCSCGSVHLGVIGGADREYDKEEYCKVTVGTYSRGRSDPVLLPSLTPPRNRRAALLQSVLAALACWFLTS
ncbi:hypothetical protein Y032_0162g3430 [Ancylostoma ceylanicum]|nr:hypothetical protein Y032_0162g3430 [Ancylostoma ceylanicum]